MPSLQASLVVTDFFDRASEMRAKFDELFGVVRIWAADAFTTRILRAPESGNCSNLSAEFDTPTSRFGKR